MKRILQIAVLSVSSFALLVATGVPAQAAVPHAQYQPAAGHDDHRDEGYRHRGYPAYYAPSYDRGYMYYDRDYHAGRSAAIVGGSAAAGALIGAAAGHAEGAAVGAVVGGVAGLIANQAVQHHDRR